MSQIIYVCSMVCIGYIDSKSEVYHVSSSAYILVLKGVPVVNLSSSQSYNFQ
jgi:hypothetical protein